MEPIDEVAISNLQSYKDKKFADISKEDLDLGNGLLMTFGFLMLCYVMHCVLHSGRYLF